MTPRHQVSRAAIALIKRFEGCRRQAAQLPDGRWTIGYGHTRTARRGAEVSEADAEALLIYDLIGIAKAVGEETYAPLNQNQFDALCAFAFNVGLDEFRGSAVLKRVNEGAYTKAAFAMELWRKADFEGERIVIDALVRRRAAEKLLFLTPADGVWPLAPSPVLRPSLDLDGPDATPRQSPSALRAETDGEQVRLRRDDTPPEPESPVTAAAASVTARLQALFPDPEPEPQPTAPESAAHLVARTDPPPAPVARPEQLALSARARIVIDDMAPFEFVSTPVQPLPPQPVDGVLGVVFLAVLGLAFFAGGVFWALAARPAAEGAILTPVVVGWLAGLAGVGFLAAAVFLFLQRLARGGERRGDSWRF